MVLICTSVIMENIQNTWLCNRSTTGTTTTGTFQFDAFGRLRVSQPHTLFDSHHRYKANEKFYSNVTGNGTVTYSNTESSVLLNVTQTSGDGAYQESKYVFNYQPGKSLLILNTFVMSSPKTGLTQRVGYFGTNNGYYIEQSGTTVSLVERSNGTSTSVQQSVWNGDRLDGTGPSKFVLDLTKSQIFFIDIEWLGAGSVRIGFVINGQFVTCHTFHHANIVPRAYMTTGCLPVRYEIFNTTGTSGSSTLRQICSTVLSEGGYEPKDQLYCVSGPLIGQTLTGTLIPVCSIRLDSGRLDAIVTLKQVNVAVATNNDLAQWRIVLNGTLTGATFAGGTDGSTNINVDTAASAISGGRVIEIGFAQTGSVNAGLDTSVFESQLGRNSFLGTSDVLTLCLVGLSANPKAFWSLAWSETI